MTAGLGSLFEPIELGPVTVANRVFVAPHTTNFAPPGVHHVTDRHLAYHQQRAAGGAGLIITEGIRVHPTSLRLRGLQAYDDDALPGLTALAETVHAEGVRLFAQLLHTGRHTGDARRGAWAPSAIPWATGAPVPHAMNRGDVRELLASYRSAAQRVLAAGFDGFEVHIGHGHLLQQFLSPVTNHRGDEYGGSLENRLRLPLEVLAAVREQVEGATAMGIRLSAEEFLPGGLDLDQMVEIVGRISDEVPLDFFHVSHSAYIGAPTLDTQMADMTWPTAPFRALPARFRQEFPDVPVLAICRIDDLATGAEMVDAGEADMVGMARAHIADPRLVKKASGGDLGRVRSCIACNQGCNGNLELTLPITCTVNPEVGLEREWDVAHGTAAQSQRVVVVGGGPAGMEAAITAARRGHDVTLWEQRPRLGGSILEASALPGRDRFALLVDELTAEIADLGVAVETGRVVCARMLVDVASDVVVLASGAKFSSPEPLPGAGVPFGTPAAALADPGHFGSRVVIVDRLGTWAAAGLAEMFAQREAQVYLVSSVPGVAWNVTVYSRLALLERLGRLAVTVRPLREPVRFEGGDLLLQDTINGAVEPITEVTGVIEVNPPVAQDALLDELGEAAFGGIIHLIGDAYAPRTCLEAVYDGRVTGVRIGVADHHAIAPLLPRAVYEVAS